MNWASSRNELPEQSTIVRERPASAAPIVTQLVTQPGCQKLKRNRLLKNSAIKPRSQMEHQKPSSEKRH